MGCFMKQDSFFILNLRFQFNFNLILFLVLLLNLILVLLIDFLVTLFLSLRLYFLWYSFLLLPYNLRVFQEAFNVTLLLLFLFCFRLDALDIRGIFYLCYLSGGPINCVALCFYSLGILSFIDISVFEVLFPIAMLEIALELSLVIFFWRKIPSTESLSKAILEFSLVVVSILPSVSSFSVRFSSQILSDILIAIDKLLFSLSLL